MSCKKYTRSIDTLLEGELDGRIAGEVNSHIFACPECASRYETLKLEKEIYANYLFSVEPAGDLRIKFQRRLEAEKAKKLQVSLISANSFGRMPKIFGFSRLLPTFAGAVLLIILGIGFGLWNFAPDQAIENTESIFETKLKDRERTLESQNADKTEEETDLLTKVENEKSIKILKNNRNYKRPQSSAKKVFAQSDVKLAQIKTVKAEKKVAAENSKKDATEIIRLTDEERLRRLRLKNTETEIAGQIEKLELLLRSFRNARMNENGDSFDVVYEKKQARKLLTKNVRLRQSAGFYGNIYAEEILGKAEPLLLDIANLEDVPAPEKVADIKERVSNQSIIASLQVY